MVRGRSPANSIKSRASHTLNSQRMECASRSKNGQGVKGASRRSVVKRWARRFRGAAFRHHICTVSQPTRNSPMFRSAIPHITCLVPFGNSRPNPSVEGTAKRLRLLSAPHLAR